MAFAGLHVVFGYAGGIGGQKSTQSLISKIVSSETRTTAGAFAIAAPAANSDKGHPIARFYASADWWVAIGAAPNSATNPRMLIPANTFVDMFVEPGHGIHGTPVA